MGARMADVRACGGEGGFAVSKSLAWTIAVGLIGAGLWLGTETATTKQDLESLRGAFLAGEARSSDRELRLRRLETEGATQAARLGELGRSIDEIKNSQREILVILREK